MSLRIRRGTEQERIGRTFDQGEIIWTTNGEKLYVGDGVTPGGKNVAAQLAGTNLAFNATTGTLGVTGLTTDLVTEGLNNKYFSAEAAQDAIGAAIAAGSQSGINVVYNDNGAGPASINFTVTGGGGGGGLSDIVLDTTPSLGGNLDLNSKNLFGTGSIDITGNITITGGIIGSTLALTTGLGTELILNGNDISGTGDVRITGDFTGTNVSVTGTISAINGLGYNLNLNSRDITGFGGINIVGDIGATNIVVGTLDASGSLSANTVSNGALLLENNIISSSTSVNGAYNITIGVGTTITSIQPTASPSFEIKNLAGALTDISKISIEGYKGTLAALTSLSPGNYVGGIGFGAIEPVSGASLPTCLIASSVDVNGVINSEVANGKLVFATTTGTSNLNFDIKYLTFDSRGQLAINQETALTTLDVNGTFRFNTLTPASSSATGVAGQMAWDSGYLYICTATNVWKRVALTTF